MLVAMKHLGHLDFIEDRFERIPEHDEAASEKDEDDGDVMERVYTAKERHKARRAMDSTKVEFKKELNRPVPRIRYQERMATEGNIFTENHISYSDEVFPTPREENMAQAVRLSVVRGIQDTITEDEKSLDKESDESTPSKSSSKYSDLPSESEVKDESEVQKSEIYHEDTSGDTETRSLNSEFAYVESEPN